jgi:hypothetical protein
MSLGPLWEATRDLHHACEQHAVGAAMASGTPPPQWYVHWLSAILQIHEKIDPTLPAIVQRCDRLRADILAMNLIIPTSTAAQTYCNTLTHEVAIAGASYVLTGAHLMGGEVMRRRLHNYPTLHLLWDDRKAALSELNILRSRTDIAQSARDCFGALLAIMDEIEKSSYDSKPNTPEVQ